MMSLAVPGPNGTTIVIGLLGKSWAPAGASIAPATTPAVVAATKARRDHLIGCMSPPLLVFVAGILRASLERNAMRWNRARFHLIAFARTGDACCRRHDGSS